ncbi:MAG: RNA polymerase sigma factor [Microthrixaceae bacterium]
MSAPSPDDELVARARTGDRGAFEELLRGHDRRVRGLAFRLVTDRSAMDEVTHAAYLEAHRGLDRLRPGRDFGDWLYRIAYNSCVDWLRRTDGRANPPPAASGGSASEVVRAALAALPVNQRAAVVLVDAEGFEPRHAAKVLGVAPRTLASRLDRARAALHRVIGEELT